MAENTRKVVWVGDIAEGSSPHEAACSALEVLSQEHTATTFKVNGEFVEADALTPGENRKCYDGVVILTPLQLAKILNEWERRYLADPEQFANDMTTAKQFMAQEHLGEEPSYGLDGAGYMMSLAKDLGFA